jgi:hypothetical protein
VSQAQKLFTVPADETLFWEKMKHRIYL